MLALLSKNAHFCIFQIDITKSESFYGCRKSPKTPPKCFVLGPICNLSIPETIEIQGIKLLEWESLGLLLLSTSLKGQKIHIYKVREHKRHDPDSNLLCKQE